MEWITSVWVAVEPFVERFLDWLISTGIGAAVALYVIRRWERRHQNDNLSADVAEQVSSRLVSSDIQVSLESVNRAQLENIRTQLMTTFGNSMDAIALQTVLIGDIARIMLRFKAATQEEKEAIATDLARLTNVSVSSIDIQKTDPIVINVQPIKEDKKPTHQNTSNDDLDLF